MAKRLGATAALVGQADDYRDPAGAVAFLITRLVREYAAAGGDLHNITIHCGRENTTGRVSRGRLTVHLTGVRDDEMPGL